MVQPGQVRQPVVEAPDPYIAPVKSGPGAGAWPSASETGVQSFGPDENAWAKSNFGEEPIFFEKGNLPPYQSVSQQWATGVDDIGDLSARLLPDAMQMLDIPAWTLEDFEAGSNVRALLSGLSGGLEAGVTMGMTFLGQWLIDKADEHYEKYKIPLSADIMDLEARGIHGYACYFSDWFYHDNPTHQALGRFAEDTPGQQEVFRATWGDPLIWFPVRVTNSSTDNVFYMVDRTDFEGNVSRTQCFQKGLVKIKGDPKRELTREEKEARLPFIILHEQIMEVRPTSVLSQMLSLRQLALSQHSNFRDTWQPVTSDYEYVWFLDDGFAGQIPYRHGEITVKAIKGGPGGDPHHTYMKTSTLAEEFPQWKVISHSLSGSQLWRMAKVTGPIKVKEKLCFFLSTPDMEEDGTGFWFSFPLDGFLIRSTDLASQACILSNYQLVKSITQFKEDDPTGGFDVDPDPVVPVDTDASDDWHSSYDVDFWGGQYSDAGGVVAPSFPEDSGEAAEALYCDRVQFELDHPRSDMFQQVLEAQALVKKGIPGMSAAEVYDIAYRDIHLGPDDPCRFYHGRDTTAMGTAPIFAGDDFAVKVLKDEYQSIQDQRNWVKTMFYHDNPLVNREWKIERRMITTKKKQFMREYRAQIRETFNTVVPVLWPSVEDRLQPVTVIPKYFPKPGRRRLAGGDLVKRDLMTSEKWDWDSVFEQWVRIMGYLGVTKSSREKLVPGFELSMDSVVARRRLGKWRLFVKSETEKGAPTGDLADMTYKDGDTSALRMLIQALTWRGFKVSWDTVMGYVYPGMTEIGDEGTPADDLSLAELKARQDVLEPMRVWLRGYYRDKHWKAADPQEFETPETDPYYVEVNRELTAIEDAIKRKRKRKKPGDVALPSFVEADSGMSSDEVAHPFLGFDEEEAVLWSTYRELPEKDRFDNKSAVGWLPENPIGLVVQVKKLGQVHYGFIEKFVKTKYRIRTARLYTRTVRGQPDVPRGYVNLYQKRLMVVAVAGKMQRVDVGQAMMPPPPRKEHAPRPPKPKPHPRPATIEQPLPDTDDESSEEEAIFVPDRPKRPRHPPGHYKEVSQSPSVAREFRGDVPPEDDTVEYSPPVESEEDEGEEEEESKLEVPAKKPRHPPNTGGYSQNRFYNPDSYVKRNKTDITQPEMDTYVVSEVLVHGGSRTRKEWYCPYCDTRIYSATNLKNHLTSYVHFNSRQLYELRHPFQAGGAPEMPDDVSIMSALTRDPTDLPVAGPDSIPPEPIIPEESLAIFDDDDDGFDARYPSMNTGAREEDAADIENLEERLERIKDPGPPAPPEPEKPTRREELVEQEERGGNVVMFLVIGAMFLVAANYMT